MTTITINTYDAAGRFDMNELEAKEFFNMLQPVQKMLALMLSMLNVSALMKKARHSLLLCLSLFNNSEVMKNDKAL